jgi:hypothetical protein
LDDEEEAAEGELELEWQGLPPPRRCSVKLVGPAAGHGCVARDAGRSGGCATSSTTTTAGAALIEESVGLGLVELAGAAGRGTPVEYRALK